MFAMNRLNGFCAAAIFALAVSSVPAFAQSNAGSEEASSGQVEIKPGRMLYVTKSVGFAPIYSVTEDGSAQVLFEGRRITIPASTITEVDGRLVTSLTKRDIVDAGNGSPH
jgi:hypothetical protein